MAMPTDQAVSAPIVPDSQAIDLYRKMLGVFYVEERLKIFVRLGKCSFHASTRGHEMLQVSMALLLEPRRDWFFTYYRSKAIAIALGMPFRTCSSQLSGRETRS